MGIDAKDIQILICRIFKFSVNTCSRFVQKYPVVSSVLFFLFALYLFFPSVFYFLVYSFLFIVCTAFFIHLYFDLNRSETPNEADVVVNRDGNSSTQTETFLQKEFEGKDRELDTQMVEEKLVSANANDDFIGESSSINEEKAREIIQERRSFSVEQGESSSHGVSIGENTAKLGGRSNTNFAPLVGFNDQASRFHGGSEAEMENSSSEEDDDEEEAQRGGGKAVEWTEDDQKNLMDLGISELERNRRLESLIARRRARKSFKMPIQKRLIEMGRAPSGPVLPVLIARTNPFDIPKSPDEQIPGSAPSILLPSRNPFDLPYDALEEKPDLTADSFHQEFMAAHQKDLFFCRHESFSLGPFVPLEGKEDQNEGFGYSKFKRPSDNGDLDKLVGGGEGGSLRRTLSVTDLVNQEGESSDQQINKTEGQEGDDNSKIEIEDEKVENARNVNEIQMETNATKNNEIESSPSSSDEEKDNIFNANCVQVSETQSPTVFEFPEVLNNPVQNSLSCPVPKARILIEAAYDSIPSVMDKSRIEEETFYGTKGPWHTPSNSIASDLQVEVSEVGSPPVTVDESPSSSDRDSLTYDGDIEKEITSGSDEMWGASPLAPRSEEHQITSREIGGEDITEEVSGFTKEHESPIISSMQPLSSSPTERSQESQAASTNFDQEISSLVKQIVSEVEELKASNSLDGAPPRNALEGTSVEVESMTHKPHEMYIEKPQERLILSENSVEEVNTSSTVDDRARTADDIDCLKPIEDEDHGTEQSTKQPALGLTDLSKPAEGSTQESGKHIRSNSDKPASNQAVLESGFPIEEKKHLKLIESVKGDGDEITRTVEGEDNLVSTQDGQEVQSTTEAVVIEFGQVFDESIISTMQPEMVTEQVAINSSSSASPKSVLQDISPNDQIPSSVFNQQMHTDASEFDIEENIVTYYRSSDGQIPESSVLISSQTIELVVEKSTDQPLISGSGLSMEPFNTKEKLSNEANEMLDMNISTFNGKEVTEDLKLNETTYEESALINKEADEEPSGYSNSMEHEAVIGESKPEEGHAGSTVDGLIIEEETTNSPRNFTEEANIFRNVKDPSMNDDKNGEKLNHINGNESEFQISNRDEATEEPSEPAVVTTLNLLDGNSEESTENEEIAVTSKPIPDTVLKPEAESDHVDKPINVGGEELQNSTSQNSTAEVGIAQNNESVADDHMSDETRKFKPVEDSGSESQILEKQENFEEPSKSPAITNPEFNNRVDEDNMDSSNRRAGNNSLNDMVDTEDPGIHESELDAENQRQAMSKHEAA